jgi:cytochrome c peroxidase
MAAYYQHLGDNKANKHPADNQITIWSTLGRVYFYDKSLSKNRTISCASCHKQENAFLILKYLSKGFNGGSTGRNSMSLIDANIIRMEDFLGSACAHLNNKC